jgi:hypothetical protein
VCVVASVDGGEGLIAVGGLDACGRTWCGGPLSMQGMDRRRGLSACEPECCVCCASESARLRAIWSVGGCVGGRARSPEPSCPAHAPAGTTMQPADASPPACSHQKTPEHHRERHRALACAADRFKRARASANHWASHQPGSGDSRRCSPPLRDNDRTRHAGCGARRWPGGRGSSLKSRRSRAPTVRA